ncbi:histidine kinase [Flammeovirga yaeyamensis]|uniref:Histidine kinase n=1 Tax=Flammeovirga yaeyamensis TaxID=367791 RepID=A0AAX1N2C6_9BACT|nr:histidine kinase [Flammeovirga yaeyamensis]MBB3701170.1 sensor histidine kinase YesM [Flammeovirga yaeyamensis]NMF38363.1 histidine kinase [Flammeovirga yaeyamensis]QWG01636.1 histidine kinase [Flammeovirga yaeyamensis]
MDSNSKELNLLFNARREFWITNTIGWVILYAINVTFQTQYFTCNFEAIFYSIVIAGTGFMISLFLRYFYSKIIIQNTPILITILKGIAVLMIISFLKTIIDLCFFIVFEFEELNYLEGEFEVLPYMFSMLMVLSIWSLIYFNYKYFENQKKIETDKLKLSLELKQLELSNLKDQLSPHFLFNAINNIRSLILIDAESARESLVHVSELLRYILNYQNKTLVHLEEEIEIVKSYIQLNQLHFGDKVEFILKVNDRLLDIEIPPLSIQLLLENAIKHGDINKGSSIEVHVFDKNNEVFIYVKNQGSLRGSPGNGIGLRNLEQRLISELNNSADFKIFEKDHSVTAQITIKPN